MSSFAPVDVQSASDSPVATFVACHVVALLGIAMMVAPFALEGLGRTMGNGAYSMVLIGAIVALAAFLSSFIFFGRLSIHRELLHENTLLAHWHYDAHEWRSFADAENAMNRTTLGILIGAGTGFAVLYFGAVAVFAPKVAAVMSVAGLAVIALLAGAASISAWRSHGRDLTPAGEVRIGRRGLWLDGTLHTWSGRGTSFRECRLDEASEPMCLVFSYATRGRRGEQVHEARVPIPRDRLEEAKQVMASLNEAAPD